MKVRSRGSRLQNHAVLLSLNHISSTWLTDCPLVSSRLVSVCRSCWRSWSCPGLMWSTPAGSRLIGCWRGGPASCRRSEPRYTCWHRWEVLHWHQGKTVSIRLQLNMVSLLWRADDSLCYCWSLKCKMLKIKWRCLVSLLSQADGPLKPSWTSDLFRPAGSGYWTEPTGPPEASCPTGSDLRTWERTEKSVQTNHSRDVTVRPQTQGIMGTTCLLQRWSVTFGFYKWVLNNLSWCFICIIY